MLGGLVRASAGDPLDLQTCAAQSVCHPFSVFKTACRPSWEDRSATPFCFLNRLPTLLGGSVCHFAVSLFGALPGAETERRVSSSNCPIDPPERDRWVTSRRHSGCRRGKNGLTRRSRFHPNSTHWPSMWRSFPFLFRALRSQPQSESLQLAARYRSAKHDQLDPMQTAACRHRSCSGS